MDPHPDPPLLPVDLRLLSSVAQGLHCNAEACSSHTSTVPISPRGGL